jgi:hypothetical protein
MIKEKRPDGMNKRGRKNINEDYLNFIRCLPCAVSGKAGEDIHAHHVDVIGMSQVRNDYYAIPLSARFHVSGGNHITLNRLTNLIKENPLDRIIFYNSLYIDFMSGRYDIEADTSMNFITLKRKLIGIE